MEYMPPFASLKPKNMTLIMDDLFSLFFLLIYKEQWEGIKALSQVRAGSTS